MEDKYFKTSFDDVMTALQNLAKGAKTVDIVEEYVPDDSGNSALKSKKISTKYLAPDLAAIKLLLSFEGESNLADLSDEELENEKNKLFKLFEGLSKSNNS